MNHTEHENENTKVDLWTNEFGVDTSLVASFLKMTPEERLEANDEAVRTILELRNAFKQKYNNARS